MYTTTPHKVSHKRHRFHPQIPYYLPPPPLVVHISKASSLQSDWCAHIPRTVDFLTNYLHFVNIVEAIYSRNSNFPYRYMKLLRNLCFIYIYIYISSLTFHDKVLFGGYIRNFNKGSCTHMTLTLNELPP